MPDARDVDYLKLEIADRMVDRLLDIKRDFKNMLDLGSGAGYISKFLEKDMAAHVTLLDSAEDMLRLDQNIETTVPVSRVAGDEELLPFEGETFDCIISSLSLHWVNDLPGTLIQARKCLKNDGVFIGSMFGGDTLYELRTSLQLAETERTGGIGPRVSPMADVRDLGSLLSRAGLTLTTVDIDEIVVNYPSMFELLYDLRMMGETNAIMQRKPTLGQDVLYAAAEAYQNIYGKEDGTIPATFQVLYMIGWKPDPSQPKSLPRGSGEVSLIDALGDQSTKESATNKDS